MRFFQSPVQWGQEAISNHQSLPVEAHPVSRRPWEAPVLSVLMFRETAGSLQAGADNPEVASFTPGGFTKDGPAPDTNFPGPFS
jgi:hypothetical protein